MKGSKALGLSGPSWKNRTREVEPPMGEEAVVVRIWVRGSVEVR